MQDSASHLVELWGDIAGKSEDGKLWATVGGKVQSTVTQKSGTTKGTSPASIILSYGSKNNTVNKNTYWLQFDYVTLEAFNLNDDEKSFTSNYLLDSNTTVPTSSDLNLPFSRPDKNQLSYSLDALPEGKSPFYYFNNSLAPGGVQDWKVDGTTYAWIADTPSEPVSGLQRIQATVREEGNKTKSRTVGFALEYHYNSFAVNFDSTTKKGTIDGQIKWISYQAIAFGDFGPALSKQYKLSFSNFPAGANNDKIPDRIAFEGFGDSTLPAAMQAILMKKEQAKGYVITP